MEASNNQYFTEFPEYLYDNDTTTFGIANFYEEPVSFKIEFDTPTVVNCIRAYWASPPFHVNTDNASGNYVEWSVTVPSAQTVTLDIRYANGSSNRPCDVVVNGTTQVNDLDFNGTGAWNVWAEQTITVSLNNGVNTIRLVAASSGGAANIDKMDVTYENGTPVNQPPEIIFSRFQRFFLSYFRMEASP